MKTQIPSDMIMILLLLILNIQAAVTPPVKAINAHNAFIDGKFKNDISSYEQFGNYNNKFFPMGWMDEFASAGEETSGKKTFEQYRKVMGDVNFIRVGSVDELIWNYGDYTRNGKSFKGILSTLNNKAAPLKFIMGIKRVKDKSEQSIDLLKKQIKLCDSIFIKSGRNNKDIIGWYIDEPNNMSNGVPVFTVIQLKAYTTAIREAEKRCGWSKRLIFANFADIFMNPNDVNYVGNYLDDLNIDIICSGNYSFQETTSPFLLARYDNEKPPKSIKDIHHHRYDQVAYLKNIMKTKSIFKPIIYVPQGQAHKDSWMWQFWKSNNSGIPSDLATFNKLWYRIPSYSETRFSIWQAIAQGATGILPWAARMVYHPCNCDGSTDYVTLSNQYYGQKIDLNAFYNKERDLTFNYWKEIYKELNTLSKYICYGTKEDDLINWQIMDAPDNSPNLKNGFETFVNTICIKYENKYYLIVVNNNHWDKVGGDKNIQPQTIRFQLNKSNLDSDTNALISIKCIDPKAYTIDNNNFLPSSYLEHRSIQIDRQNSFTDRFEAGDVHVYEISIVQK